MKTEFLQRLQNMEKNESFAERLDALVREFLERLGTVRSATKKTRHELDADMTTEAERDFFAKTERRFTQDGLGENSFEALRKTAKDIMVRRIP